MKNWIGLPRREGRSSRQAHVGLPEGTFEREAGREGFFGPSTRFYHAHPPTGWSAFEGELRPRAFDLAALPAAAASPWRAPDLLFNAAFRLRFWRTDLAMDHLVRNADGDDLVFLHAGAADLYCDYGHLALSEGDYLLLPRGTMWRLEPREPVAALLIEATNDAYRLPEKGLLGAHAIFDPGMLDVPAIDDAFAAQRAARETRVEVKRGGRITTITYPHNPLDAVGWQGDLAPVRVNWRDIRPLMSHRYHLPPSAHTTFAAGRFVVCTFVPRPAESDPEALKVPFFHSNDDYDEIIFYHRGAFFSRDNIRPGMMTLHPCGFPHGPQPKALAKGRAAKGGEMLDEVAVMIDARDAVTVAPEAETAEWGAYVDSWREGGGGG
jgi:homogentisate 1,2-dioxygenase